MELNEKLQELRKSRGLTQEELAELLFVSRTAVSKWETGKGYPSIDSLREISRYFSVSIDDLLSADKLISIAERENKSNIRNICDIIIGIADIFALLLIAMPLYPKTVNSIVYSVNLFSYAETSDLNLTAYWFMFLSLIAAGAAKLVMVYLKKISVQKTITIWSSLINILTVILLAVAGETYAVVISFLILMIKIIMIFEVNKFYI